MHYFCMDFINNFFLITHKKPSKVGVLTSGGDAPGMNAAIRAVIRTGIYHGMEMAGIIRGFTGILENDIIPMDNRSVANIIQRGGTILKSARCQPFFTKEGRKQAFGNLQANGIEALIVIGGDGSFRGALEFSNEYNIPCIGIPGTIDKDLAGTDYTIGFDTAVNTAVSCIDKIRDTMEAHDRLFIVEVMGRHAGYIALYSGIATGAEYILIPETHTSMEEIAHSLSEKEKRKKLVNLVVIAEGHRTGGAVGFVEELKKYLPALDARISILGHIQRGGQPTCIDRMSASRMGYHAIECLLNGKYNVMVGIQKNTMSYTPFAEALSGKHKMDEAWMKIVKILAS